MKPCEFQPCVVQTSTGVIPGGGGPAPVGYSTSGACYTVSGGPVTQGSLTVTYAQAASGAWVESQSITDSAGAVVSGATLVACPASVGNAASAPPITQLKAVLGAHVCKTAAPLPPALPAGNYTGFSADLAPFSITLPAAWGANYEVYVEVDGVVHQGNQAGALTGGDWPVVLTSLSSLAAYLQAVSTANGYADQWGVDLASNSVVIIGPLNAPTTVATWVVVAYESPANDGILVSTLVKAVAQEMKSVSPSPAPTASRAGCILLQIEKYQDAAGAVFEKLFELGTRTPYVLPPGESLELGDCDCVSIPSPLTRIGRKRIPAGGTVTIADLYAQCGGKPITSVNLIINKGSVDSVPNVGDTSTHVAPGFLVYTADERTPYPIAVGASFVADSGADAFLQYTFTDI